MGKAGRSNLWAGMGALMVFLLSWLALCVDTALALHGSGTQEDPWRIQSLADFDEFSGDPNFWDDHTRLETDINLAARTYSTAIIAPDTDSSDSGFQGIPFTGVFDGNGHTILNATISNEDVDNGYLGLFGRIGCSLSNVEVRNLGLENVAITGDRHYGYVGALCGYNCLGTIRNCYATGSVSPARISYYVGGLCGRNKDGVITNCYAAVSVTGRYFVGGLCGLNEGTISNCYAIGSVSGDITAGALCAVNHGTISNCYFYLFGGPSNNLGDPLDEAQLTDADCFSGFDFAGNPDDGTDDDWAIVADHCPKLSWQIDDEGLTVPNLAPSTTLGGTGHSYSPFQIDNPADFNEFINNNSLTCGYYVLNNDIDLSDRTFDGPVIDRLFGGHLEGSNHVVRNVTIDTAGVWHLGLFRALGGFLSNLGIENITITGSDGSYYFGGLCAVNTGPISNCYATGSVTGGKYLAGLCGENLGPISSCYATVSVTGDNYIGGLVGFNDAPISDCYATGSLTGDGPIGGLVGFNCGAISNCYATGLMTGGASLGGVVGWNYSGSVSNCFWDMETSGVTTSSGGEGKTTAEMQTESTFSDAGWDFTTPVWTIGDNDYPRLWWQSALSLEFAGFDIIEKTRTGRTLFRYVLSLSLTNVSDNDMTDVRVMLIDESDQVVGVDDDEIIFPVIETNVTVDSNSLGDYFVIEVDRSELIIPGTLRLMVNAFPIEIDSSIACDDRIGVNGLMVLSSQWLKPNRDGIVNFLDFARLANNCLGSK